MFIHKGDPWQGKSATFRSLFLLGIARGIWFIDWLAICRISIVRTAVPVDRITRQDLNWKRSFKNSCANLIGRPVSRLSPFRTEILHCSFASDYI